MQTIMKIEELLSDYSQEIVTDIFEDGPAGSYFLWEGVNPKSKFAALKISDFKRVIKYHGDLKGEFKLLIKCSFNVSASILCGRQQVLKINQGVVYEGSYNLLSSNDGLVRTLAADDNKYKNLCLPEDSEVDVSKDELEDFDESHFLCSN